MLDIFFCKNLANGITIRCTFCVENISASFASVLAPDESFGLNLP